MDITVATEGFSAMGSESRLAVLQTLIKAGQEGLPVGMIADRTSIPGSTLAHHLKFLAAAGLITQNKEGRVIRCRADFDHLEALAAFILEQCCAEAPSNDDRGKDDACESKREDAA